MHGKTLIIDALSILSGGRFSKEMIRQGQKNSYVEMSLDLPKINKEENIIVSREINLSGKNICKINGRLVTVAELKEFMNSVIDIHGQNENQSLLEVSNHIKLLDKFAEKEIIEIKEKYKKLYFRYIEINKEIKENFGDEKEKQRMLDLLKYQLNEIEDAELKQGEEDELYEKRKLIMNSEKIAKSIQNSKELLNNSIIDALSDCIREMDRIGEYNEEYNNVLEVLKGSYYDLQEAESSIALLENDIEFDEDEQNKIEKRLDLIQSLKRKYGNSIEEILEFQNSIQKEIDKIENNEEYIKSLKAELDVIIKQMNEYAIYLTKIREKNGKIISQRINEELKDLEMNKAEFEVKINSFEGEFNLNGIDKIEFLISTNVGNEKKPLAKIASGGEMSRIMLAIKNVLAECDDTPIMVFDEIDTGISGNAGVKTGEKIKNIAKKHQVICITHLASIAAKGDYNFYIYKENDEIQTRTKIKQLDEKEVLEEIARISSGTVTDISLNLAKQLRQEKKIA